MPDEELYPTMRFYTCPDCGQVFTGSLTGENACPSCRRPMKKRSDESFYTLSENQKHVAIHIRGGGYRIGDLAQLKQALEKLEAKMPDSIAFLFDGNSVLDSGFLNLMARTVYLLSQQGRRVFVVAQDEHLLDSLQVLGLDRVLVVLKDEKAYQEALTNT